jgi:hypothetical protein
MNERAVCLNKQGNEVRKGNKAEVNRKNQDRMKERRQRGICDTPV